MTQYLCKHTSNIKFLWWKWSRHVSSMQAPVVRYRYATPKFLYYKNYGGYVTQCLNNNHSVKRVCSKNAWIKFLSLWNT